MVCGNTWSVFIFEYLPVGWGPPVCGSSRADAAFSLDSVFDVLRVDAQPPSRKVNPHQTRFHSPADCPILEQFPAGGALILPVCPVDGLDFRRSF